MKHKVLLAGALCALASILWVVVPGNVTVSASQRNSPTAGAYAYIGGVSSVRLGTVIGASLDIASAGNALVAAQNYFTFTNSLVQISDPNLGSVCSPTNTLHIDPSYFETEMQNQVCNGTSPCTSGSFTFPPGSISFASGTLGAARTTSFFQVASFNICANALGTAIFHPQFSPPAPADRDSEIVDANANLVHTPSLYLDYALQIMSGTMDVNFTWQARATAPSPQQQLPVTLTLRYQDGVLAADYPVQTTDSNGWAHYDLGSLPEGTYTWRVKGPRYLARSGSVYLDTNPNRSFGVGLMKVGDANNDNVVNAQDFAIFRAAFGATSSNPAYDTRVDFNSDNVVNVVDFAWLRANYGQSGAPPIGP